MLKEFDGRKIFFKNTGKIKSFRQTKTERIHYKLTCTTT